MEANLRPAKQIQRDQVFAPIPHRPGRCDACGGPADPPSKCCRQCDAPIVMQHTGLDVQRVPQWKFGQFGRDEGWLEDVNAYRRAEAD